MGYRWRWSLWPCGNSLSLGNILAELQNDLSLLSTDLSNVADRHRSLNQVFDYAWQRLTVEEQQMLAALTIFRGGFSWSAGRGPSSGRPFRPAC